MATLRLFSYIMAYFQVHVQVYFQRDHDEVRFVLDQHAQLDLLVQTCHSTRTHYPDSEPTNLCSFSLMLRAQWRNNKFQFYSLWFYLIWARRQDFTTLEASWLTITPLMQSMKHSLLPLLYYMHNLIILLTVIVATLVQILDIYVFIKTIAMFTWL